MRQQVSFLTQSRFYSPAFNAAIFDGPLRIHFAQYQESLALKVYFTAQQRLKDVYTQVRDVFRKTGVNIFVMLYPSPETFVMSFEGVPASDTVVTDRLGHDFVIGVRGPMDDEIVDDIYERIEEIAHAMVNSEIAEAIPLTADEVGF